MPALMAVISGNSEPLKRELLAVQRMADQTGKSLQNMGGGSHAGSSGAIRELLVLTREMARGNWTRVPGSLSILMQRMGLLNFLMKDSAKSAEVLASAWEQQAAMAGLAAVAATRKAQASLMAFEADTENTEATLAQAVADEEGAAAAIANAKAMQAKAVAARESATASAAGAGGGAAAGAVGGGMLGIMSALAAPLALIAVSIGSIFAGFKQKSAIQNIFGGLNFGDFKSDYIAKHLQSINRIAEEQKQINNEIQKSVELYNSAAKSAERVNEATKSHYEHLRRMNSFEKDPAKKAQRELEIDAEERLMELRNKATEKANLEIESGQKQKQAQSIQVSSKEHDEDLLRQKKQAAEAAQKYLDSKEGRGFFGTVAGLNPFSGAGGLKGVDAGLAAKRDQAAQAIKDYKTTVDQVAANEELRKKREELIKQAGSSAAAAALIGKQLPEMQKKANQANADELEEAQARSQSGGKMVHGYVNDLQRIGAYAAPAVFVDLQRQANRHLASIDSKLGKIGGTPTMNLGKVKY